MPTETDPLLPKGFLRPCLLLLLRAERAHGYDLLERVQSLGIDGSDPGGLYRALRSLEREKLVRSFWEPSGTGPDRRIYVITRAGDGVSSIGGEGDRRRPRVRGELPHRYQEFVALEPSNSAPRRSRTPVR